jgi:RNA polymerase sporulation-specific sigma factor
MPAEEGPRAGESLRDLVTRAKRGDAAAVDVLFRAHQRLIWHVLKRITHPGTDTEDLYQVGAVGLMKAIHRFDPDRGVEFATYAVPLILGEMRRFLRDDQTVHVSRSLRERAAKVLEMRATLAQEMGREPTPQDIAGRLGWDVSDVVEALESRQAVGSLDAPEGSRTDAPLLEHLVTPLEEAVWVGRIALDQALERLNARERLILRWRYDAGATQAEIAKRLGISQVQVSRLERQALERLRAEFLPDDAP